MLTLLLLEAPPPRRYCVGDKPFVARTLIGRRAVGGDIPVVLKIMRVHREFVCFAYHPLNCLYTFCSYLVVLDCSMVDERMVVEVEGT